LVIFLTLYSCDFFNKESEGIPIARVNNAFLYQHDVVDLIPEGLTEEDSLLRINNFINQWATQQLLISGAKFNLSEEKQKGFDQLIKQYESDLYTKAYIEALVKQRMDTSITSEEAQSVYQQNLESFKLNEDLIKFRYINVDLNYSELDEIEERLKRFNREDIKILDSISIQFRSYSLNDSIWIKVNQAVEKIPVLNPENRKELLKKSNFMHVKDSLGLYLMQISEVLGRNEIAPIEYVMPTIKQIVINKRKLEFIRQLEKDITKDAIKNGQFELYN
jgi:hypothetical protein